ncbi:unnamed protein product [Schistocephalus solidus]|uniref:Secreted protein n=1 Tax=Schistocephalus solidus TaxID=70667 RepID=A0A183TDG5_SCHSO|nr:unnamed protein product [Schistocephalus solidus]
MMCAVSYAFLRLLSPLWAFRLVFSYSLLYLSWANIYRMTFDYASISADVSFCYLSPTPASAWSCELAPTRVEESDRGGVGTLERGL